MIMKCKRGGLQKVQVNRFQKHLLLHQLTHIMTKDCSLTIDQSNLMSLGDRNVAGLDFVILEYTRTYDGAPEV